jgi:hypothetical protein
MDNPPTVLAVTTMGSRRGVFELRCWEAVCVGRNKGVKKETTIVEILHL